MIHLRSSVSWLIRASASTPGAPAQRIESVLPQPAAQASFGSRCRSLTDHVGAVAALSSSLRTAPDAARHRGLEKCGLPAFLLALEAVQPQMTHPPAAGRRFLRRLADARTPPDLDQARSQLVAEWAALRLMLEQGGGHEHSMPGRIKTTLGRQAEKAARGRDPASSDASRGR
jgi:hypothetical protein